MDTVRELVRDVLARDALIKAVLSGARRGTPEAAQKVTVRPLELRRQRVYQLEEQRGSKVFHANLPPAEAEARIVDLLAGQYRQGHFFTREADVQVVADAAGRATIRKRPPTQAGGGRNHDRRKNYVLPEGEPVDFFVRLGVMTAEGRVVAARAHKFRQINRFLEMVADVAVHLPADGPLRVVDFGSGKSYLTFALYHYLHAVLGRDVQIVGLDLKADVIEQCGAIARDLGYDGLSFEVGTIEGYRGMAAVDMVVSLHACDTATDDALAQAVGWDARVILAVPCCQHELFRQIEATVQRPLLRHGILKERLAALVTDGLRAQLLELAGYQVQVMEFIDLEHTPKNLLIRAVKQRAVRDRERLRREFQALRDYWHVRPALERSLEPLLEEQAG